MRFKTLFFCGLFPWLAFASPANDLSGNSWKFEYENGQHYLVNFFDSELRWKGVKGTDLGKTEIDSYQSDKIAAGIYFVNWTEADGSFITLAINLNTQRVYSTGVSGAEKWRAIGVIKSGGP